MLLFATLATTIPGPFGCVVELIDCGLSFLTTCRSGGRIGFSLVATTTLAKLLSSRLTPISPIMRAS